MIYIDRGRVHAPPVLKSDLARAARADARSFYKPAAQSRAQRKFSFNATVFAHPEVQEALRVLFRNKCAFCETLAHGPIDVIHYRPAAGALALDGTFDPDHYWALAYSWSNLYLSCVDCARHKGHRFPVLGRRAPAAPTAAQLRAEQPVLFDPCDDVDYGLVFSPDGLVASRTARGRDSIEILGLHRSSLVKKRQDAARHTQRSLSECALVARHGPTASNSRIVREILGSVLSLQRPYCAMQRQLVRDWFQRLRRDWQMELIEFVTIGGVAVSEIKVPATRTRQEREKTIESYRKHQLAKQASSFARRKRDYFSGARLIERIELENFRVFENLVLDTGTADTETAPWLVILGENGTGKSSILQGIALSLMDSEDRGKLEIDPRASLHHIINNRKRQYRRSKGSVRVHIAGFTNPIELRFSRYSNTFHCTEEDQKVLLLGYGSTRLLPRHGSLKPEAQSGTARFARVRNLFNPYVPLADAGEWLLSLGRRQFDVAAKVIKDLLSLDETARIRRGRWDMEVEAFGSRSSLRLLSDGYQSMLALSADIMSVMFTAWTDMTVAEGVVLIDELEAHLHPMWKMRIVSNLKKCFPRIQFIVTTHDPLCLRGLSKGEVVVLKRDNENRVFSVTDLPDVRELQTDQLLTSDHFGLHTSADPDMEQKFSRYYDLLANPSRTRDEEMLLLQLKGQITKADYLGMNRRDQALVEGIDKYLALAERTADREQRGRLYDKASSQIARKLRGTGRL